MHDYKPLDAPIYSTRLKNHQ